MPETLASERAALHAEWQQSSFYIASDFETHISLPR